MALFAEIIDPQLLPSLFAGDAPEAWVRTWPNVHEAAIYFSAGTRGGHGQRRFEYACPGNAQQWASD